jgi:hypothetical protein
MNSKQNGGGCPLTMNGGGNGGLVGSQYEGTGVVNTSNMLKTGTSYVSFDHNDSKLFAGSYPGVVKSVHQCGGKRIRNNRTQKKNKSNKSSKKQRKNKSNKSQNKSQNRRKQRNSKRKSQRKN